MIHVAHAGIIDEAPSILELILNLLTAILNFAGALAVLILVIAGLMYITAAGDMNRISLARKAIFGSVIGIVIVLISLVVVSSIARTIA